MRILGTVMCLILLCSAIVSAGNVRGIVKDADSQEPLIGANVTLEGTIIGSMTDLDGVYVLTNVPAGSYTLVVSYLGYAEQKTRVQVTNDQVTANIEMASVSLLGDAVEVISNRARERETPVAFTDINKEQIKTNLGSRDIPLVLNTTPSIYATADGGGAGDARVNVRGFNQRNVGIMINGVPVNDMENGWVYWSNWDGVGDASSSIQVQRGLSAVNLATPSIGGTMNILTDPTANNAGGQYKQEFGNDGFLKSTLSLNTGLIDGKYAVSALAVRKLGDGLIDGTWTDAWAYYFGASYNVNSNNRLELYAIGAPQRHGQRLFAQNIGVYSHDYARSLDDYDPAALDEYNEAGFKFNQNVAPVSSSYSAQQSTGEGDTFDRYDENFISERENFFHKPQVNLNYYSRLSENLNLFNVFYYSGGSGGGTGTLGSLVRKGFDPSASNPFASLPWSWDWDATIERNANNADGSRGILRNSRNNQWQLGAISKLTYKVNPKFKTTVGLDWRTAEIEHYREVRDLLGGAYYRVTRNEFAVTAADSQATLGEKVDYDFTNTVDWIGFFGQGEYVDGPVNAYAMAGYSTIKYGYTNFFTKGPDGNELTAETDNIGGFQVKGGAGYLVTPKTQVYLNAGYVSKVPIFDNVIDDGNGVVSTDPQNEKFISLEAGVNTSLLEGKLNLKGNLYNTSWTDRSISREINNPNGTRELVFITGLDALHQGIEFEAAFQPNNMVRFDGAASVGNWTITDDVNATYRNFDVGSNTLITDTLNLYIKDLKVGDAPQTQFALAGSVFPVRGLMAQLTYRYYARYYSDYEPLNRTDMDDRTQSWQIPNYGVVDFHASYNLPLEVGRARFKVFAHVFNLLDEEYIQDATDNSRFSSFDDDHDADDAEVFFGLPRFFNTGLEITF